MTGITSQALVLREHLDITLVSSDPVDIHLDKPYITDDADVVHPVKDLSRALFALDPDIVVFHTSNHNARNAARKVNPFMITVTRLGANLQEQALASENYTKQMADLIDYFTTVDHIIASSNRADETLQMHGIDRASVIPTAIDIDEIQTPDDDPPQVVGLLGRTNPIKNHFVVVQAAMGLRDDTDVLMAGKRYGPYFEMLNEVTPASAPTGDIRHGGYVDDVMDVFFPRVGVLCHPSLTENCPQTVLESIVSGTPVVVSDAAWARSYSIPFRTAYPDDPAEWMWEIRDVFNSDVVTEVEDQQEIVKEKYSIDVVKGDYVELFEDLLDRMSAFKIPSEVAI